jgi:hypothetical protein
VARALTNDTFHTTRAYTKYQRQVEDVFDALYRERGVYYRAFQRPQTFERILMMKLACIVPDILHKRRFADEDSLVWNALAPVWQRTIEDVHVALTSAEAGTLSEFGLLRRVRAVALGLHDKLRVWDRSRHIEWGEFFDHYGDQLQRDEYHVRGDGLHLVGQCGTCETWMTVGPEIERCPVCGGRDARATPMVTGAFETAQAAE